VRVFFTSRSWVLSPAVLAVAMSCGPGTGSSKGSVIEADGGGKGGAGGSVATGSGGGPVFAVPDSGPGLPPPCSGCADAGPSCGNWIIDPGEVCDDGNAVSGDGCVGTCTAIELDFACPPRSPCVSLVKCGDGAIAGKETCDDHNTSSGDGCDATCQAEPGWKCPAAGQKCVAAACGDGIVAGNETCEDGNVASADGCDATCRRERGWACVRVAPPAGDAGTADAGSARPLDVCHRTVCGDAVTEGDEQCDDGNRIPYDACSPGCTAEPKCAGGTCTAVCGDGLKFPQEGCDDGNRSTGDGCDAACKIEAGFACQTVTLAPPAQLQIPILYRDFLYKTPPTALGPGHPDFESFGGSGPTFGMVQLTLGSDGKPVFAALQGQLTSADSFYTWYHETQTNGTPNPYEKLVYLDAAGNPTTLTFNRQVSGAYQFANPLFLPLDGLGWVSQTTGGHNFAFTSELRYQFTYAGGEVLDFTGDDDVWVFINGKLAVDLGGLHPPQNGKIILDATAATNLGLTVGGMYEIALFQAERHTSGSSYTLTLSGFVHAITQCQSVCGDGIVTPNEVCDDGVNNGGYGSCTPDCMGRGPTCGDGVLQPDHEKCDDGVNLSPYGGCAPGCVPGDSCGDGKVDSRFGEQCDNGAAKNDSSYNGCTDKCKLGPRCGDGVHQASAGEECDDGNAINRDSCTNTCKIYLPQ
jgi:fibro-slime domain-containing protein